MKNHKIGASVLSIPFPNFSEIYRQIVAAGIDFVHLDIMDGNFVPNLSFSPVIANEIKRMAPHVPIDIHFMITSLAYQQMIQAFLAVQPIRISVHVEAFPSLEKIMHSIKDQKIEFGVALNPDTPINTILPWLAQLDFILLMSVNPGFGGQLFNPVVLRKAEALDSLRKQNGYRYRLEVDGGVQLSMVPSLAACGVDWFIIGSDLVKQQDPAQYIHSFRTVCPPVL